MIIKSWEDIGVESRTGQYKSKCICSAKRTKNPEEECLSINNDLGIAHCHNCGENFIIEGKAKAPTTKRKDYVVPPSLNGKMMPKLREYFLTRGISSNSLELNHIGSFIGKDGGVVMEFPYYKDSLVNIGYRKLDEKNFKFYKGAEICMYGMQNLLTEGFVNTKKLIICEGQIDLLSFFECGLAHTISVPNGSPFKEGQEHNAKLEYLEDPFFREILEGIDEIIIATDNDYAGNALASVLSNRLGVERCSRMLFGEYKDANDLLVNEGRESLLEEYSSRKAMIEGIASDIQKRMINYYSKGLQSGLKCGIESFDEIFTLEFGNITLVTGIPESGKSLFLDNINVGYALENDLHIAVWSPETKPLEFHVARLVSILTGENIGNPQEKRIDYQDYLEGVKWVDKHFSFLEPKTNNLDEILNLFKVSILNNGTKICVIDPFSRIKVEGDTLTFINNMLNEFSAFALKYNIHLFVVAHPSKPESTRTKKDKPDDMVDTPIITPYQIKGSGAWYDSADFILSLWRTVQYDNPPLRCYVLKSKLHHIAKSSRYCSLEKDGFRLAS